MPSRRWVPAGLFLAVIALWAVLPMPAVSQDEGSLRNKIDRSRAREQQLSGAVARLSDLLARTQREITIVQGRLTEVEADLATARAKLAATTEKLNTQQAKLARLKQRLAHDQAELAAQLVANYKGDNPDLIGAGDRLQQLRRPDRAGRARQAAAGAQRRDRRSHPRVPGRDTPRDRPARRPQGRAAGHRERRRAAPQRARQHARGAGLAAGDRHTRARRARRGAGGHARRPRRRRERAQQADRGARGRRARDLGRPRRPVGDPVADRAVRIGRPEPPAQQRGRLRLLPDAAVDLEGPRRLDPGRVPGLQGRAGPPRRHVCGPAAPARTTGSAPAWSARACGRR